MAFSVYNHRLLQSGSPTPFVESPNRGATFQPRHLIIHGATGMSGAGATTWFMNPDAQASVHLVIDRDGAVTQLVEFNRVAWHAGQSAFDGVENPNSQSIGVELVNAGQVVRSATGAWRDWTGEVVSEDEVVFPSRADGATEGGWQRYTSEQLDAVIGIGLALRAKYGLEGVLGDRAGETGRGTGPGPAFPMERVAGRISGRR